MTDLQCDPTLRFMEPQRSSGFVLSEIEEAISSSRLRASLFSVAAGACTPEDSHAVHEIWLVAEGRGSLVYDGYTYDLSANKIYYFVPFKTHQVFNAGPADLVIYSVWWP